MTGEKLAEVVYCYNADDEFCSKFGSISITKGFGGIVRNG